MRIKPLLYILLFLTNCLFAQEHDGYSVNLPRFYKQQLHFGFTITFNQTDFRLNTVKNSAFPDTVITNNGQDTKYYMRYIYTKPGPGFAIGLVTDFRLHEYIRLRTTPNISFASRRIEYFLSNNNRDSSKLFEKTVESTFLIFPIETKIQSKRLGNFSAYVIGGGGYMLDLASRKKTAGVSGGGANQLDDNVKLKRDDFYYSGGAGVDFYLMYFKLGFELKLHMGTRNLLRKENSVWTNSLEKVKSRMVTFTITFEG
ncbi:MAG: outer membrane beta-barrel protein [Bacteroidia bacterium]